MTRNDRVDLEEARELHLKANEWMNSLITAGVAPRAAAVAMLTAVTERALLDGGQAKTVQFLRGQARLVEQSGGEWLAALKS